MKGKSQAIYFSRRLRFSEDVLQLNGRDIPFVNNVTYLGVTFDRRLTERLSTNITLTLYKALIRSVITYASPTWEYAADGHPLKLQRLQNRVLRATGNLDRCTPVPEMQVAFKIIYPYYINKSCRTQAEVILNHRNPNVSGIRQGETMHRKYNSLKLGGGQAYDRSAD
jgi:hypothetical protein